MTRCEMSDLPTNSCAHCTGNHSTMPYGDLAYFPDARIGRRVWPPTKAEPDHIGDYLTLPPTWAPGSFANECRCSRPTRDSRYLCDDCADLLAHALGEIPWVVEQIDITIARQKASGAVGSSRTTETPLPWHERAADAKRALLTALWEFVTYCDRTNVTNSSPQNGLPAKQLTPMSRWMLWRVDGLTTNPRGPEAVETIVESVAECRRIILWKRKTQVYLGPCDAAELPEGPDDPCPGEVYADEDAGTGCCDVCETWFVVTTKRKTLEDALDDRLFTANELARLTTFLGLDVPRERVRTQIRRWEKSKRIAVKGEGDDGQSLFRYGDVKPLLYSQYAKIDTPTG